MEKCHCGEVANGHVPGYCDHCSWTRCDAYPGDCGRPSVMLERLLKYEETLDEAERTGH